jgi:hypothetical protein
MRSILSWPNQVLRLRGLHSGALLSVRWDF